MKAKLINMYNFVKKKIYSVRKTLYFAFFLSATAMIVTGVTYAANSWAAPIIEQNRIDTIDRSIAVLFSVEDGYVRNEDQDQNSYLEKNYKAINEVYEVVDSNNEIHALIYNVSVQGRNGIIDALVAIDPYTDTIVGVSYYKHTETPNIGEVYTRDVETVKLIGQSLATVEVDVISGASTTWGAIINMFEQIKSHYNAEEVHIDG